MSISETLGSAAFALHLWRSWMKGWGYSLLICRTDFDKL